jgi:hypothetical protein
VKICGRCAQSIRGGERYTAHPITSPSGPGMTVYRHVALCKPVPTQTTQVSMRH